jgi:hypothetical protein
MAALTGKVGVLEVEMLKMKVGVLELTCDAQGRGQLLIDGADMTPYVQEITVSIVGQQRPIITASLLPFKQPKTKGPSLEELLAMFRPQPEADAPAVVDRRVDSGTRADNVKHLERPWSG